MMKDSLIIGLALGLITGAVLTTYNRSVQNMVEKGKDVVKRQVNKIKE